MSAIKIIKRHHYQEFFFRDYNLLNLKLNQKLVKFSSYITTSRNPEQLDNFIRSEADLDNF